MKTSNQARAKRSSAGHRSQSKKAGTRLVRFPFPDGMVPLIDDAARRLGMDRTQFILESIGGAIDGAGDARAASPSKKSSGKHAA